MELPNVINTGNGKYLEAVQYLTSTYGQNWPNTKAGGRKTSSRAPKTFKDGDATNITNSGKLAAKCLTSGRDDWKTDEMCKSCQYCGPPSSRHTRRSNNKRTSPVVGRSESLQNASAQHKCKFCNVEQASQATEKRSHKKRQPSQSHESKGLKERRPSQSHESKGQKERRPSQSHESKGQKERQPSRSQARRSHKKRQPSKSPDRSCKKRKSAQTPDNLRQPSVQEKLIPGDGISDHESAAPDKTKAVRASRRLPKKTRDESLQTLLKHLLQELMETTGDQWFHMPIMEDQAPGRHLELY